LTIKDALNKSLLLVIPAKADCWGRTLKRTSA